KAEGPELTGRVAARGTVERQREVRERTPGGGDLLGRIEHATQVPGILQARVAHDGGVIVELEAAVEAVPVREVPGDRQHPGDEEGGGGAHRASINNRWAAHDRQSEAGGSRQSRRPQFPFSSNVRSASSSVMVTVRDADCEEPRCTASMTDRSSGSQAR